MKKDLNMRVGVALRVLRELSNKTQAQLAADAGIPRSTLNNIEIGRRANSLENLDKLSRACGYSIGQLFSLVDGTDEELRAKIEERRKRLELKLAAKTEKV